MRPPVCQRLVARAPPTQPRGQRHAALTSQAGRRPGRAQGKLSSRRTASAMAGRSTAWQASPRAAAPAAQRGATLERAQRNAGCAALRSTQSRTRGACCGQPTSGTHSRQAAAPSARPRPPAPILLAAVTRTAGHMAAAAPPCEAAREVRCPAVCKPRSVTPVAGAARAHLKAWVVAAVLGPGLREAGPAQGDAQVAQHGLSTAAAAVAAAAAAVTSPAPTCMVLAAGASTRLCVPPKCHLNRPSTGSRTITMIFARGVSAAMRRATCGRHAWTGHASKHCHCTRASSMARGWHVHERLRKGCNHWGRCHSVQGRLLQGCLLSQRHALTPLTPLTASAHQRVMTVGKNDLYSGADDAHVAPSTPARATVGWRVAPCSCRLLCCCCRPPGGRPRLAPHLQRSGSPWTGPHGTAGLRALRCPGGGAGGRPGRWCRTSARGTCVRVCTWAVPTCRHVLRRVNAPGALGSKAAAAAQPAPARHAPLAGKPMM